MNVVGQRKSIRDVRADGALVRACYGAGQLISRYFDVKLFNVERVPQQGRVMLVGNHALLGVDTWALLPELWRQTQRVPRGMGLRSLFDVPLLGSLLEELGMVPGERHSAVALLERDELVLTYPGGAQDSLKARSERYKLKWEGRQGFAHVALKAQAPIVPVVGVGPDECFQLLLDQGIVPVRGLTGRRTLKVPLFLPYARRIPFEFHFGAPLHPPAPRDTHDPEAEREDAARFAAQVEDATQTLLDARVAQRVAK